MPQIVHQVKVADDASPKEQAEAVSRAVSEVAGYASTVDHAEECSPLPVMFAGQIPGNSVLEQALKQALQQETVPFELPFTYPGHFSPREYAMNSGLALADEARGKVGGRMAADRAPSLNILPSATSPGPCLFGPSRSLLLSYS